MKTFRMSRHFYFPLSQLTGLALVLLLFAACNQKERRDEPYLAVVNGEYFYPSMIKDMNFSSSTGEDSLERLRIYISRWVRDELVAQEAEKKTNASDRIKELVEEYRKSLLVHKFEVEYVEENLDSSFTPQKLRNHYEENKASFTLQSPIYRCRWLEVHSSNINTDSLVNHWETQTDQTGEKWVQLAEIYAHNYNLKPEIWWDRSQLEGLLLVEDFPLDAMEERDVRVIETEEGKLVVNLVEKIEERNPAPLAYVEESIRKYLLHQRKEELLQNLRNDLYEKAVDNNKVKINLQ